ncbi:DsbA family protein [Gluconobacter cerinus]|uniref:DsbA family protein n=1 Tax=Gluconobacter cerinus TaxID=38307 RepID=UPI001B8D8B71|nr:thioredoxin [Gluconobacter cerinus]MBS1034151.1 thioredoxin [Gluconobacter cerinus]
MTFQLSALEWGAGPKVLEVFLEPTCPFSVKTLRKIPDLLQLEGQDRLTVRVRLQSQPWHMFSGVIVRAILAASSLDEGRDAALAVMMAVADHREEFEFTDHCRGPNMDATPADILQRIEVYSGVPLAETFVRPEVTAAVKWHARYGRQNGIHVSPTFMVDGLVDPAFSSGDSVDEWGAKLFPVKE